MSTVMRPRGPLPPRVYWTRRLLLLAVLLVVLLAVWQLLPSGGDGSPTAATTTKTTGHPPDTTPSTTRADTTTPATTPATKTGVPHTQSSRTEPVQTTTTGSTTTAPSGPCDPKTLELKVQVDDTVVGKGVTVGLALATPDGSTCTLGISPDVLEARVYSGQATVWASVNCPDGLAARNVVVGPRSKVLYSFHWDGKIHPTSCSPGDEVAGVGYYWAEAAFIGGQPSSEQFYVAPH